MGIQDKWRYCSNCQALAFAGGGSLGVCQGTTPPGGAHNFSSSGNYGLVDDDVAVPGQDNWRWCRKCQAMCFAGSGGSCAAGGQHDHTGSGDYTMEQSQNGTLGQDNWRWCRKCQVLAFAGGPSPGACAAGGVHDHTGSGDYVLTQVPDCSGLLAKIDEINQKIAAIEASPGYIKVTDPTPGKPGAGGPITSTPNPVLLAQVHQLQAELPAADAAYAACQAQQHDAVFDLVCNATTCVSIKAVYASIAAQLDGKVVGYACSVGRTLTYQAFGDARTNANAPARPFLSATKITVASVSKIATALAAIRVLGQRGISLDAPIGGYLPSDWVLDPAIAAITFRQLLAQSSGIKDYGDFTLDYAKLKWFFTLPVVPNTTKCTGPMATDLPDPFNANDKSRCYSNYNFAIFRILLPLIDKTVADAPKSANFAADLAAAYVKIVGANVFEPVGVSGVDTKPPATGPQADAYAFAYLFPGTAPGFDWGDNTLSAGAAGWYFSVEDFAAVLASLNKNDGRILTAAQLQDMLSSQLGWDWLTDLSGNRWVEKNGGWGTGSGQEISTSVALFGPGLIGVLFMNSDTAGTQKLSADGVLHNAYLAAIQPRP